MKYLHPYLYEIIHDQVQKRIEDKKFPYVAIENDVRAKVMSDIANSIEEMAVDGLIAKSENINGIGLYMPLKSGEDENNNVRG